MVLVLDVEILRQLVARIVEILGPAGVVHIDHGEPVGGAIGEWLDQHILNDAEDDRGGADAQSQRDDRQQRKTTVAAEAAQRIPYVLGEPVQALHTTSRPTCKPAYPAGLIDAGSPGHVPQNSRSGLSGRKSGTN